MGTDNTEVIETEKDQHEPQTMSLAQKLEGLTIPCPECEGTWRFYNYLNQTFIVCEKCKTIFHACCEEVEGWSD